MLLTHRKLLQSKAIAIENDLRGTLRNFGLKVGMVGTVRFEARIQELVATIPDLAILVEPLLVVLQALREQMSSCTSRLLAIVRNDEVCQRLMTTPRCRRRLKGRRIKSDCDKLLADRQSPSTRRKRND
jgi:transposase